MKRLSLVLAMVLLSVATMLAQRTISGTITDNAGEALIGASVLAKGTAVGTTTDIDGTYSLTVPDGTTTIEISYTGFATQDMTLGASNVVDIVLQEGVELSEVVVTGLGIRKEKKALGYAVTTLGSADVELKPEADVGRILRGKVPGVDITSTSGLAGSGTNIIIRGYSSITGNNQPLFVVDGVPFNTETNNDRDFESGGATASSRFLDLDPNSIAEISVLKGLSATVLYGEAGRNGVILVTTKNGNIDATSNKKFEVTLNQSVFATQAASIPDDQDLYGNGWQNAASAAFSNWGSPFEVGVHETAFQNALNGGFTSYDPKQGTIAHPYGGNASFPEYAGGTYDYQAYDNLQNFFETGVNSTTSLSVASQVGKNTSISSSYAYLSDKGFIPNNVLNKHNFGLGTNTKLDNGIAINSVFNFISSERNSPPAGISTSSNPADGSSSLFSNVLYTPRSVSLFDLEYADPTDNSSIYYRGGNDIQHPLWTLNNANDQDITRRFFGRIQASYQLTDWLGVMYRLGLDTYSQRQRFSINKGGTQIPDGLLETSERLNFLTDQTFGLTYDHNINEDWNLNGVVGANIRSETTETTSAESSQQFLYGLQIHDNYNVHVNTSELLRENNIGAYATATLGFRSFLYLSFQGRNDWTSTLEKANRSVFYPSGSVSFIPTDAFTSLRNNDILNYLKVRVGYGTSAGYPDPYETRNFLRTRTNVFTNPNTGAAINTNSISNRFGNPDLTPELHGELEVGLEAKLLRNRVGIDLSLYDKQSRDLIIALDLDPATGGTITTNNTAEVRNVGIELGLNFVPVRTTDFTWDIGVNFTANENTVESLSDGVEQIAIAGYTNLGNFAIPEQPYGIMQGGVIQRDEATGLPLISSAGYYQSATEIGIIGDPNPDFTLNGITSLSYKGLGFRMQWDYVHGGDMLAATVYTLLARGILQETDFDRFVPVVAEGVDAEGNPNTVQITPNNHHWVNGGVFNDEIGVYDATTVRLREISLSYELPTAWLGRSPFGSASITLAGQNLWYKAINIPAGANFDPEVSSLGVGNGRGFDYMTGPTARRYGASLRLTF